MAKSKHSARETAARVLAEVIIHRHSLTPALTQALPALAEKERALCQQLCYGVLRLLPRLEAISRQLLQKPLKKKDGEITALLYIGLYQLLSMRIPPHAVLSETVNSCQHLGRPWAKKLINACLRNFQRRQNDIEQQLEHNAAARFAHPPWLLKRIQQDWPRQWPSIIAANNQQPPMILRVNTRHQSRDRYLDRLRAAGITASALAVCADALRLDTPCDVNLLPGFKEGAVSVQDGAAQAVIDLMQIKPGLRILDACAAPGGKTCHILEKEPDNEVIALDIQAARLEQIRQNLQRLRLNATLIAADAAEVEHWWDGQLFDRILIDAPCSGIGVIRRHPDIKLLRQPEDIAALAEQQARLLARLWPLLKPDGILIYTTCSILKQENTQQIASFLQHHPQARENKLTFMPARRQTYGFQRLPGDDESDGFYYASLCHR